MTGGLSLLVCSGLRRTTTALGRRLLFLWAKTKILPEDIRQLGIVAGQPVFYILKMQSFANLVVLEHECSRLGLPRPSAPLHAGELRLGQSVFALTFHSGIFRHAGRSPRSETLAKLLDAVAQDPRLDVQLVPVSVFWGQAPDKERSGFKLLFSDYWALAGRLRQFFMVLIHSRNIWIRFSPPVSLRRFMAQESDRERVVQKLSRVLRVHFHQLRLATLGPDLSHRRTLVAHIVRSPAVRNAIAAEVEENGVSQAKAQARAYACADEIAADMSYPFVLLMRRLLSRLWDRLYEGIELNRVEALQRLAPGNEIVYVPCHRSHIDYMLLSYELYRHGLAIPHVAAGLNLNIPLIGPLLRKGGAFYLHRSFKGDRLYAAVFNEYVATLLGRGVPIEYFVEGGRSRTGRSLPPKPGMLDMTVRAYFRNPQRPVMLMPVYIGYEKLVEGQGYVDELAGGTKKKETLGGFFRSLRALRSRFGKVYLNFGEPIFLNRLLDEYRPDWRAQIEDPAQRPDWLPPIVAELGRRVMTHINSAAAVNPINLLALILLSAPRRALGEADLAQRIDLYLSLLEAAPYSDGISVVQISGHGAIAYGENLGLVQRRPHPLGDILSLEGGNAVLMSYFRNNILHLFSLSGIVACCFLNRSVLSLKKLIELATLIYPFIQGELFLRWPAAEIGGRVQEMVEVMVGLGLLDREAEGEILRRPDSLAGMHLKALAQSVVQTLERFYISIALLMRAGPHKLRRADLEKQSQLMAQRLSVMYYGFDAPEFFDPALLRNFVGMLRERGLLWEDAEGLLDFDSAAAGCYQETRLLVGEQVRHDILLLMQASKAGLTT